METTIKTPPRIQDDLHITLLHATSGSEMRMVAQRVILANADGTPLPQPVKMPLDGVSALAALHAGLGQLIAGLGAAGAEPAEPEPEPERNPNGVILLPGGGR